MSVVISPPTTTRPVVISVSQATRPVGSSRNTASSTASEIWSAILSGCPSVTDSELSRKSRAGIAGRVPQASELRDLQQRGEVRDPVLGRRVREEALERFQRARHLRRQLLAGSLRQP